MDLGSGTGYDENFSSENHFEKLQINFFIQHLMHLLFWAISWKISCNLSTKAWRQTKKEKKSWAMGCNICLRRDSQYVICRGCLETPSILGETQVNSTFAHLHKAKKKWQSSCNSIAESLTRAVADKILLAHYQ